MSLQGLLNCSVSMLASLKRTPSLSKHRWITTIQPLRLVTEPRVRKYYTSSRKCAWVKVRAVPPRVVKRSVPVITPKLPALHLTKEWNEKSGQKADVWFDAPLCGKPDPLGAHYIHQISGVNFAVFSSSATSVSLVLLTDTDLQKGTAKVEIKLDPFENKTGDIWHIALPNMKDQNLLYGYHVDGPHQETSQGEEGIDFSGHRCNSKDLLLDPYSRVVIGRRHFGALGPDLNYNECLGYSQTWSLAASCIPHGLNDFDWEGDRPLNIPLQDLVIYEMHVRAFTRDESSHVKSPGTYEGLVEKLDYLKELGVNCIELMPVYEFNELEYYKLIPGTKTYRYNVWGYSTVNFFAPMSRYSASIANGGSGNALLDEFKAMVKECHKRGIEVLLDVVFNHTAEGNHQGPSLSFRGLDNRVYYMLAPAGEYYNYSGCGNTFNCNHPVVRRFIVDCLKYWVLEMHIDGFRFDLASIMTRAHSTWHPSEMHPDGIPLAVQGDEVIDGRGHMENGAGVATGTPLSDPTLIAMISEEPTLRNIKLIAEAWDCDGLNQVGAFPHYGGRWAEWNGRFRDVVRNFIKGTDGTWASDFADVICGSPNLYCDPLDDDTNWWMTNGGKKWSGGRGPMHSVNFITAHDGFSLADLVSYNEKHNEANGENNQDGENHNNSWNSGDEGITKDPIIKRLRKRQIKNFFCALFLSHGVPMMLMGDEYAHSKEGNNNTYCHDDSLNWFNWNKAQEQNSDLFRFTKLLIKFRMSHEEFRRAEYVCGDDIIWHGDTPFNPDWSETSRLVAYTAHGKNNKSIYVAYNTSHLSRAIVLPQVDGKEWELVIDTGANAPFDFLHPDEYLSEEHFIMAKQLRKSWIDQHLYPMQPYSCIVLVTSEQKESIAISSLL